MVWEAEEQKCYKRKPTKYISARIQVIETFNAFLITTKMLYILNLYHSVYKQNSYVFVMDCLQYIQITQFVQQYSILKWKQQITELYKTLHIWKLMHIFHLAFSLLVTFCLFRLKYLSLQLFILKKNQATLLIGLIMWRYQKLSNKPILIIVITDKNE